MLVFGWSIKGKTGSCAPELHEGWVDASPVVGYIFILEEDDVSVAHYRKNYN
jgi:hypothetical protein